MAWGAFEERNDESGAFIAYHVVPMVRFDSGAEPEMSGAHTLSGDCPCHPFLEYGGDADFPLDARSEDGMVMRWRIWQHHDADHPGAMSEDEWREKAVKSITV
jgi:hypothetical protein